MQKLAQLVEQLPPDVYQEVQDFVEFLLQRRGASPPSTPEFSWAGALKDLREQYSSVALQHQATNWRLADGE
ncbi:MAG: DUF2281 domain-containing protein [Anaerolineae bacterium]|jgi:hypothetical protein|nr:DUF2281 domain-containing protein [Anaerolineae bacterium]